MKAVKVHFCFILIIPEPCFLLFFLRTNLYTGLDHYNLHISLSIWTKSVSLVLRNVMFFIAATWPILKFFHEPAFLEIAINMFCCGRY